MVAVVSMLVAPTGCATPAAPGATGAPRAAAQSERAAVTYSVRQPRLLPDRVTVPLERRGELLFVDARVDGRDVGEFLVDTGADMTFVDRAVADELGLPELVDVPVAGVHEYERASLCTLETLSVGDVQLDSTATLALPLDDLSARVGRRVAGIVGFPTLGSTPFTIDFAQGSLTVYNADRFAPPSNVDSELLRIHEYAPFVEATLGKDGVVWLLLDSGSLAPVVLWRRFVKDHPEVLSVPHERWALSAGVGGGTQVMMSEAPSLRVLGRQLENVTALVQEPPPNSWDHPRVAGIVGLELLRDLRVTIDPVKRRIWAEPSGSADRRAQ